MKVIVAIGGAVIKTAWEEIKEIAQKGWIDVLIHNGGSLFHDFQRATNPELGSEHSYSLSKLMSDYSVNEPTAKMVWAWLRGEIAAPEGSLTRICEDHGMDVLMFTIPGADFWHLFDRGWELLGSRMSEDFFILCNRMRDPFHFICMGSAVVMPEVFTKALADVRPKDFKADVVDFLDMYRPRTRVACYGTYYQMEFKEFFKQWKEKS
ncbi:MAG: hypothetical protein MUP27_09365 [Desulfobacterales bacterium]|nr:hypothetical protein [Desulfobacterales bacterium]